MRFRLNPAVVSLLYAAFASAWIVASSALVDLGVEDPALQGRIELAKGLAFVVVTSLLLFLLLRSMAKGDLAQGPLSTGHIPAPWRQLVPLLALLTLTVPLVGLVVYVLEAKKDERDATADLEVIAGFKTRQIESWLAERHGDASALAYSQGFIERLEKLQATGDEHSGAMILDRLVSLKQAFAYDSIALFDSLGRPLLAVGTPPVQDEALRARVRMAAASGAVQMSDLHRDDLGNTHLYFMVPLGRKGLLEAAGVALLHIDPKQFLFPLVESWPTLSQSGETLLVRREGDTVVYLNELRQLKGTTLTLKVPLGNARLPAAAAAREGGAGTFKGVDYRGASVLAAWQPVAGTDWKILAKLDREEVLAPARATALWAGGVMAAAAIALAAIALLLFRQQHLARLLATRLQADSLLKQFYDLPFVGMAITSPDSKRWLNFNDRLCEILGYARDELAQKTWPEMTHPADLGLDLGEFERVMKGEIDGYSMQKRFLRKDGSTVLAQMDIKSVRTPEGAVDYFVCMVEDITERVAAQAKALRLGRLYKTLGECNAAVVRCQSEAELFAEVCRASVASGGLAMAWIGKVDPATRLVIPVAAFGKSVEYLDGIRISVDPADPNGLGPTGTAIRENSAFWCQDFANDPRTAPWRERAVQYGWGASAGLPLTCGGVTVGALTLYDPEPNTLDEETRDLLLRIARDVSYGLGNFEREAARKRATQALQEAQARIESIMSTVDQVLWSADAGTGQVLYLNAAAAKVYGRPVGDFFASPRLWFECIHPGDIGVAAESDRRARETGSSEAQFRILHPGGKVRWIANRAWMVRDEAGRPLRMEGVVSDITAQKEAEMALLESEARFRGIVEQSIAGLYIAQDHKLAYANPRLMEIFGYEESAGVIGRDVLSFFAEGDRDRIEAMILQRMEGGVPSIHYTATGLRKDGTPIEVGVHGALATYQGRPAIIGLMQDITEKKRAEDQAARYLAQLQNALTHTVEVATALSEMRDPYTAGHEKRVAEISVAIAAELGWDERRIEGLRIAGYVHDIGKITVPSEILAKPGKLSAAEFSLIKGHPQAGYDVLRTVEFPWPVADMVLQHHERIDGSGYPQGLKGEAILPEARILAVADVVEAMGSHRPYRPGLGIEKALAEIERGRGTAYDAGVADACLRIFRDKGFSLPM